MTDIKCPFCQQELDYLGLDYLGEDMYGCRKHDWYGSYDLWQELIRTRKALEVAVDALGYYASENSWDETNRWMFVENGFEFARDVLVKIDKTLEQKDVK